LDDDGSGREDDKEDAAEGNEEGGEEYSEEVEEDSSDGDNFSEDEVRGRVSLALLIPNVPSNGTFSNPIPVMDED